MNKLTAEEKLNLEEIVNLSLLIANRLDRINFNKSEFINDDFIRDSFIPPLMHISETINHLPAEIADTITEHKVRAIVSMKNRLAHAYLGVDTNILWRTLTKNIPQLGITTAQTLENMYNVDLSNEKELLKMTQSKINEYFHQSPKIGLSISKPKSNEGLER